MVEEQKHDDDRHAERGGPRDQNAQAAYLFHRRSSGGLPREVVGVV